MLVCCFVEDANAELDTQGITIRQQNVPLEKIFQSIEKQTGYRFFYNESLLEGVGKVSLNLQNVSLQEALDACFRDQPFTYSIVERTIIVKRKVAVVSRSATAPLNKIIAVRGKVKSNNVPVIGATVTVKGTDNATFTDNEGVFTLAEVDDQSTLIISHVSHQAREVNLQGKTFISVDLNEKINDLDEAVVVAYNTTTQKRNTGSVTVVKGDQIISLPNRSIDKSLQGMVPGLLVTSGNGQPGSGVSNFLLRGIGTGTAAIGSNVGIRYPLIVVDGVPVSMDPITASQMGANTTSATNPMAQLNPFDIESITVLKDAAAIALYGSKASNGVILVTTKKGKSGKTRVMINNQTDLSYKLKGNVEMLNRDEYLELIYESYKNLDAAYYTDERIKSNLISRFPTIVNSPGDTSFYAPTNWEDEIFDKSAITTSNDISFSGGNESNNYYLNFSYLNQDGIVKNTGYNRTSVRFNSENRPTNWLKVGLNSAFSYNKQDILALGDAGEPYLLSLVMPNLIPLRLEDGNYNLILTNVYGGSFIAANPVASLEYNINRFKSYRGLINANATVSFLKHFSFSTNVGADVMFSEFKEKWDPRLGTFDIAPGVGFVRETNLNNTSLIVSNLLRFNKFFNQHDFNVTLGHEARELQKKTLFAGGQGLRAPYFEQVSNNTTNLTGSGSENREALTSLFGQLNYGYSKKYLASFSARRDGSSKFGERDRYGNYWSVGLGYILTEESFFKKNDILGFLKLRGSIGTSGNSTVISSTTRFDLLTLSNYNGNPAVLPNSTPGNHDIKWEETFNTDIGLEARFFKDRIGLTIDWYKRKISNLIYSKQLPNNSGYTSSPLDNIGDMENKGLEAALFLDVLRQRDFRWNLSFNWSTNKNKLIRANQRIPATSGHLRNTEGENFESFYLVTWAGVDPSTGAPQWLDSAGNITNTFPSALANRKYAGKPQPDGFGGITNTLAWRNFELAAFFYYQYGFQIISNTEGTLVNDGSSPFLNQSKDALNRWQKPGDDAKNPKRVWGNANSSTEMSTRYLYDGDFIRFKSLSLTYSLPTKLVENLKLARLKVSAQVYNLGIWTKYKGLDPENVGIAGLNGFSYPQQRTFTFIISAEF
jgi:TonB-linked SusC/RagA family outer membrane protein